MAERGLPTPSILAMDIWIVDSLTLGKQTKTNRFFYTNNQLENIMGKNIPFPTPSRKVDFLGIKLYGSPLRVTNGNN